MGDLQLMQLTLERADREERVRSRSQVCNANVVDTLSVCVCDLVLWPKVHKSKPRNAVHTAPDELDVALTTVGVDASRFAQQTLRHNDQRVSLQQRQIIKRLAAPVDSDVRIQLRQLLARGLRPIGARSHVLLVEEELRPQVHHGRRPNVVQSDALDAAEDNVLGDLDPNTAEPAEEDARPRHAQHRLRAQHVALARIEPIVNSGVHVP
jgi:hypothetical protein